MENFKDLKVWVKAHNLRLAIYQKTRGFPKEEIYGLTGQIRRASASIGANIAQGCGRRSEPEMNRFIQIARGSVSELEYHLLPAGDLRFFKRRRLRRVGGESLRNPTDVGLFIATLEEWGFS